jgi:hypothetical protein
MLKWLLLSCATVSIATVAAGAPRLSVVATQPDSSDALMTVRLDTDGRNIVGFRLVFNIQDSCSRYCGLRPGVDAVLAGLDVKGITGGTVGSSPTQPVPPPFDQFLCGELPRPQSPIAGLNGSNLEIFQFPFCCVGLPGECPLRWEPADYSGCGVMELYVADGSVISVDEIEFVLPSPINCNTRFPVAPLNWGEIKRLYLSAEPPTH